MGKSSTEIEHGVARQRDELSARISGLESRARDDVNAAARRVRERISSTAEGAEDAALGATSRAGSALGTTAGSGTPLGRHPKSLVAGSLVAGFIAGRLGGGDEPSGTVNHRGHMPGESQAKWPPRSRAGGDSEEHEAGVLASAAASLVGVAQGWVMSRASEFIEAASEGLRAGVRRATQPASQEALPAESGSAKVGYDLGGNGPPPPLEKASSPMRLRVG